MRQTRRLLLAAIAAFGSILCASAVAQTFPDKPVHVIMPFPTGVGPDAVMRLVGERLTKVWKQPVIIENKPGGNGFIAMSAAKRAPADGYTLVQVDDGGMTAVPNLFPKTAPFDPRKDFEPIAPMFTASWFVAVAMDSPFKSMTDLVAEAKQKNGSFTYGSSGVGSPMHLHAAKLEAETGVRMTHVPYKDTPQVLVDISQHALDWAFTSGSTGGPLQKAKKIRFLAVSSPQRHPSYPDVPTVVEAGGPPGFEATTWIALFAPRGVPPAVVQKLNADISKVLAEPEVQERLNSLAFQAWIGSPAVLGAQMENDLRKKSTLIQQLKISVE